MKKINICFVLTLMLTTISGCSDSKFHFNNNEYVIRSGEKIAIENANSKTKYEIISKQIDGVNLSEDGVFTFDSSIPNYTQVLVVAKNDKKVSNEVVCTLVYDYLDSNISFTNKVDYIVDSEYITAKDSNNYGITYSIEPYVKGISIDSSTGKVTFNDSVKDEDEFTVVARSGLKNESSHTYKALKDAIVKTTKSVSYSELINKTEINFSMDYSNYHAIENNDIIGLTDKFNNDINNDYYEYNKAEKNLTIKSNYIELLSVGSQQVKIVTQRNTILVDIVIATKFIDSVDALVGINENKETLAGYYIQTCDIDLTDALIRGGKYYNKGAGWTPIGTYHDTLDQTYAFKDAFTGTYDGAGHKVTGLSATRKDEQSFNFGLFGYITSSATIKNLSVSGSVSISSYSGGLCGTNNGIIENCYANVKVVAFTGTSIYRYLGGLVGNNLGIIDGCYSIGLVKCDTYYGQLVGYNCGKITNSFAYKVNSNAKIIGLGNIEDTCKFFDTLDDMKNYDYSNYLKSSVWKLEAGKLPELIGE